MRAVGIVGAVLGVAAGLIWVVTAGASSNCTITGQPEGSGCDPAYAHIHTVAGPAAVALIAIGLVMLIAGQASQPRLPRCYHCGRPFKAHTNGACPPRPAGSQQSGSAPEPPTKTVTAAQEPQTAPVPCFRCGEPFRAHLGETMACPGPAQDAMSARM